MTVPARLMLRNFNKQLMRAIVPTGMLMKVIIFAVAFLLIPLISNSFASTSGALNEVVGNEEMQMYVIAIQEEDVGKPNKRVDLEVVLKNIEPNARVFNIFFVKIIDSNGDEHKASALLSTIMPIRIPSNDIVRGTLTFPVPSGADISALVWEEFDGTRLAIDLNAIKEPPDPIPKSDWTLSSNKGRVLSDGRTQLIIHDERLNRSPPYYHVDISIKNLSKDIVSYSATYSFVKDQDGYLYPPDVQNLHLMNNPLRQGELKEGEEVRGEILFFLPDSVSNVMLIYDEQFGGGSYFAVPEFPYHALVLVVSIGTGLILARIRNTFHR